MNNKEIERMREAICKDANTEMCLKDKCHKLYRCPLGLPTIENLDILAENGIGDKKQAVKEAFERFENTIVEMIDKNDSEHAEIFEAVASDIIDRLHAFFTELYGDKKDDH